MKHEDTYAQFNRAMGAVRILFPDQAAHWWEMADRICGSDPHAIFCRCCGNDCCNSRKCRQAIKASEL